MSDQPIKRPSLLERKPDMVNNPPHYASGKIECLDAMEASMTPEEFRGYLKGTIFKYNWRCGKKFDAAEDMKKAQFYLNRLIPLLEK